MDGHVGGAEAAVLRPRAVRQERHLRVPAVPPVLLRAGVREGGPPGLDKGLQPDVHRQLQRSRGAGAVQVCQGGLHRLLRLRPRVQPVRHVPILQEHLFEYMLLHRLLLPDGWPGQVLPKRPPV
ncbi:hypothetical protein VPH35_016569 [Triticum aestivum]